MQSQPEFLTLRRHLEQTIVGQTTLIDRLMVGTPPESLNQSIHTGKQMIIV